MSNSDLDIRRIVRLPLVLDAEVRTIAAREHNGMSATIRRLLSRAIELEHQAPTAALRTPEATR